MMVKWSSIPIIDQGPISRPCPKLTPNFLRKPERICNEKGNESKRAGKKERKEEKKFGAGSQKKKYKFWLMHMHLI